MVTTSMRAISPRAIGYVSAGGVGLSIGLHRLAHVRGLFADEPAVADAFNRLLPHPDEAAT